jgi:hypothetical protein
MPYGLLIHSDVYCGDSLERSARAPRTEAPGVGQYLDALLFGAILRFQKAC